VKRLRQWAALLGCMATLSCNGRTSTGSPEVGSDLYAVAADTLVEVSLASASEKMWAYRWSRSEKFALVVARHSPPAVETCTAGPGFRAWLQVVSRFSITGTPAAPVTSDSPDWLDLRLKDSGALDPIEVHVYLPSGTGDSPIVSVNGKQFIGRFDSGGSALAFRSGCPALGSD
jgi:hypothetical protein